MSPSLAACLFVLGIFILFGSDREPKARTSPTIWLPIIWLLISGSRPISSWLGRTSTITPEQYLEGSPLDAGIYALLLFSAVVLLIGRRRIVARVLQRNWLIVIFVLYCAISIAWSDFPGVALKRWIKSLGDYAMVLIVLTQHDCAGAIKHVFARVAFILLPLSILFIKYYPSLGRAYSLHWDGTQFFVGVADTKNMLGMTCMVFGFAAVWRILHTWSKPGRGRAKILVVHSILVAMAIWLLILSDSKTSLSCFVLTSGLIAAHTFSKVVRRHVVLHMLVAAVILCCFSVLFLGIGGGALEDMGRNPTLTGRTDIWAVLLSARTNPVFGTGFESFWLGQRLAYVWSFQIVDGITEAHDGYLEFYLNLGWVGVAFLAGLLWIGYRNILRLIKRDPEAGRLRLGLFVIAVVYNFTESGFRSTNLVWIALIFAITALPAARPANVAMAKCVPVKPTLVEFERFV